jgi:hypothetical protein
MIGHNSQIGAFRFGSYWCVRMTSSPAESSSRCAFQTASPSTIGGRFGFYTIGLTLQRALSTTKTAAARTQFP